MKHPQPFACVFASHSDIAASEVGGHLLSILLSSYPSHEIFCFPFKVRARQRSQLQSFSVTSAVLGPRPAGAVPSPGWRRYPLGPTYGTTYKPRNRTFGPPDGSSANPLSPSLDLKRVLIPTHHNISSQHCRHLLHPCRLHTIKSLSQLNYTPTSQAPNLGNEAVTTNDSNNGNKTGHATIV